MVLGLKSSSPGLVLSSSLVPIPFLIRRSRAPSSSVVIIRSNSTLLSCRCSAGKTDESVTDDKAEKSRKQFEDTRIHWGASEEGWLGMDDGNGPAAAAAAAAATSPDEEVLSTWRNGPSTGLMGLLVLASDSHYRCLELTPEADPEDIKAAYRRLSKLYHPDTTSLPLEIAAGKFVRLKEAYTVLSSEEQRRYYDWQLAQKVSKQRDGTFDLPLEPDKIMTDNGSRRTQAWDTNRDFVDDPVDRLGGQNMDLSDQAQTALLFDGFAIVIAILSIVIALFIKKS